LTYSRKLLNEGEEIVYDGRPNWSLLFWPITLGLLVVAGLGTGLALLPTKGYGWVGIAIAVVFVADVFFVLSRVLRWRTTSLVVTNLRIIYRHGVVRRAGREIPIDRVQDVCYTQTVVERIVRAGSLTIESAGERGQEPFPDIAHPEKMQSMINRLIDLARQRGDQRSMGQPVLSVPEQIEKLSELHRRGVLTEEEFEKKKTELLDRM
jgi:uncharacterized membrane protein YdbT with pleckstrin-like domain